MGQFLLMACLRYSDAIKGEDFLLGVAPGLNIVSLSGGHPSLLPVELIRKQISPN
jgi:hypothetical protein